MPALPPPWVRCTSEVEYNGGFHSGILAPPIHSSSPPPAVLTAQAITVGVAMTPAPARVVVRRRALEGFSGQRE
ncbi:hypothetical protein NL676_019394 [Syzygium grande]|nr:hypothetical protein NL676_019394 [Syzygium grande]